MEIKINEIKKMLGIKEIVHLEINNMVSNAGNNIANQYEVNIYTEKGLFQAFYSYKSLIAIKVGGEIIVITHNYNYSKTTGKYRNAFLNMNLKTLDKYIKENMHYNCDNQCWELKNE